MVKTRTTGYAVLGLLSIGPMSGYDMKKFAEESIGHFWSESYGQLYPTLKDLESEGLIEIQSEQRGAGANRKLFRLTAAGLDELRSWIVRPVRQRPVRDELLLKLFFGRHVEASDLRSIVERARGVQERALADLRHAEKEAAERTQEPPDSPYWMMTLRFGLVMGNAYLQWCDEILDQLHDLDRIRTEEE